MARAHWRKHIRGYTGYEPHPKQAEIHDAIDRGATRCASVWGRRGGKTILWADEAAVQVPFGPTGNMPRRLIRLTGPEFVLTDPAFEYLWHWIVDEEILGYKPKHASARERYIQMPWPCHVECKTTDNPKALQGKGVALNVCDEHADDHEGILKQFILPTTFDTGGIVGCIGTPKGKLNHYTKTYEDWSKEAATDPQYFTSHATSYDNPHIDHRELDKYRAACIRAHCEQVFDQEVMARFVSLSGAIYDNFQPMRDGAPWHVGEVSYRDYLPLVIGVDWGTIHNYVNVIGQVIEGDRLNIIEEISTPGLDPERMVKATLKQLGKRKAGMSYCDPSGAGNKKLFRKYGIPVYEPSSKDRTQLNNVEDGILQVKRCFGREDLPGIVIDPSCAQLIKGIYSYEWNDRATKATPKKVDDDEVDALRYLVMGTIGLKQALPFLYVPGGNK